MAKAIITQRFLTKTNDFLEPIANDALFTALNAEGGSVAVSRNDDRTVYLIQNTATTAKEVTIKAGNGIQGVVDLVESIPASSSTIISLDSGFFKNVTGDDKGKVIITGGTDIKVAVFALA